TLPRVPRSLQTPPGILRIRGAHVEATPTDRGHPLHSSTPPPRFGEPPIRPHLSMAPAVDRRPPCHVGGELRAGDRKQPYRPWRRSLHEREGQQGDRRVTRGARSLLLPVEWGRVDGHRGSLVRVFADRERHRSPSADSPYCRHLL